MNYLSRHSNAILLPLLFVALISLVFLANCSKKQDENKFPHFPPREPYASPFDGQKVILSPESFQYQADSDISDPILQTMEGLRVVAVVDNACIAEVCADNDQDNSLSCYFFEHPERRDNLTTQFYSFRLPRPMTAQEMDQWAENDDCILGITNEHVYQTHAIIDPYYTANHQRQYLDTVRFNQSLTYFTSDNLLPVKVAVIDSGVGVHPDLGTQNDLPGVIWREDLRSNSSKNAPECSGYTYTNENPINPHGTFVGGIIAATQNNLGIAGIASNAQLISLTIGNCNGRMTTAEIGNAIMYAQQRGAEVINMSLGGATSDDVGLRHSILSVLNEKAVVVVSAGNSYKNLMEDYYYPATYAQQYPGLITVAWGTVDGDLEKGDEITWGSNYSPEHIKILAPGNSIVSTMSPSAWSGYSPLNPGYGIGQGSSFSAPIVTGAVALAIGFLKKHNLSYDEQMIDYLVTVASIDDENTSLEDYVRNKALLDFNNLGSNLQFMVVSGETPRPIEILSPSLMWDISKDRPYIEFTADWDLAMSHHEARLGLFDSGCGYSQPCLIQDYELSGNDGEKDFEVSRNELLPLLASLSDPAFNLYVTVAVYYKVWDPIRERFKNNFGVDAFARVNIRDFDGSDASSLFMGEVTNIRMDMQHLYVKGWACLEDSNKAVSVEIIPASGTPLTLSYAYYYPYMVPHSTPIDTGSFSHYGGPFVAEDMRMMMENETSYKAGLEANPLMIDKCKVLTTGHGFEFGIPLSLIKANNLSNTKFSVRASNPNQSATTMLLNDSRGNTGFTFPEVNYQTNVTSNVSLNRASDTVTINGSVCSDSPTPMNLEITFSQWNVKCRLNEITNFPDFSNRCSLGHSGRSPYFFESGLTDRNDFATHYFNAVTQGPDRRITNLEWTDEKLVEHQTRYPVRWPNARLNLWAPVAEQASFFSHLSSLGFQEVGTGDLLGSIQLGKVLIADLGQGMTPILESYNLDRSGISFYESDDAYYWDYIDVGEPYTPSVVGYSVNTENTVGDYLFNTLNISKFLREVKKYETPLGITSQVLDNITIANASPDRGSCPHYRFEVTAQVANIASFNPWLNSYIRAFLKVGETPLEGVTVDTDIDNVMLEVPLDMRFFQDGVMMLHLLSDFGSNTVSVPTLGRGN